MTLDAPKINALLRQIWNLQLKGRGLKLISYNRAIPDHYQERHHLLAQLLRAHRQEDAVHEEAAGHPQQARLQDVAQGRRQEDEDGREAGGVLRLRHSLLQHRCRVPGSEKSSNTVQRHASIM